jgi:phage tail sheath protein FI
MAVALSYPGVYVAEIPSGVRTITGVATSVTAFIGRALKGLTDQATDILNFGDFERQFGGLWVDSTMSFAVRDFFLNGGSHAVIVRLFSDGYGGHVDDAAGAINSIAAAAAGGANGKAAKDAAKPAFDAVNNDAKAAPETKAAAKKAWDLINALADEANAAAVIAAVTAARAVVQPTVRKMAAGTLAFRAASPGAWAGALRIVVSASNPVTAGPLATSLGVGLTATDLFDLTVSDLSPGGASEIYANVTVKNTVRRIDRALQDSALIRWDGGDLDAKVPALPDFAKVFGDVVGQKYVEMVNARATNPDPSVDPLKTATADYKAALAAAASATGDGVTLGSTNFLPANGESEKKGLYALEQLYTRDGIFNLLCIPPYKNDDIDIDVGVIAAAGAYCEERRAVLLVDAPRGWKSVSDAQKGFSDDPDQVGYRGSNGAIFFPRLKMPNPLKNDQLETFASCGVVAGICARTDAQRGVWKSPAGIDASLLGVASLAVPMTDAENGLLNPLGVNCLRHFPVFGAVSWGARTLRGADAFADEYKYLAVRRTALYIEESLYRALKWVVFEPNSEPLWGQIRLNVGAFMHNMFRQGAFAGASARDAYYVQCDSSTTTQNDINLGIVNIKVGFAPLKPAEFVVLQLQQMAGTIET